MEIQLNNQNDVNISLTQSAVTPDSFWHAINILVTKPHVVNNRLWDCKLLCRYKCKAPEMTWKSSLPVTLQNYETIHEMINELVTIMGTKITAEGDEDSDTDLMLIELLPRKYGEKHAFQLICLRKRQMTVTFYDVTPVEQSQNLCPNFSYTFLLQNENIILYADIDETSKSYKWLLTTVLPQVKKWSCEVTSNRHKSINKSLALVPHDQYYVKYNVLKDRYGKELVKIWPECTDPSKFVYEDIAIATYLLLLWEEKNENITTQSFVDLGCGNGLLVYILTMEGHNGYGIDVRKRKIWGMYPKNIKLLEQIITPSNIHTFTDVNWIIGNHSDELTPWIPVIAARSSYQCKFFLLPCCAYNFDGTKYQRQNSSKSQYTEYLEYIQQLSEDCGFLTDKDRLKIPSTKRICLIGNQRKYEQKEFKNYCDRIENMLKLSLCSNVDNCAENPISQNFKAREPTEKVRNCSQIDKNVIDLIITSITKHLLEGCKLNSDWSPGKTVDIKEIVSLLSPDTLKVLKSECGGLQTLMKNNHQIFNVQNGKVQLQYPKTIKETLQNSENKRFKSNIKLKSKACWFFNNHPQGCPLKDSDCSFLH